MMPAHFGSRPNTPYTSNWYRDVTSMVTSFVTDRDKLAAHLPAPLRVADDAVVTVSYSRNREVEMLAGHGYNMIAVTAAVVFEGEEDMLAGNYTLVVWENLADPILIGREIQGIPKIFADIPDHSVVDERWHAQASHFGHKIIDLSVDQLRPVTEKEVLAHTEATEGKNNPISWRYLPGLSGSTRNFSQFTTFPSEVQISDVQVGEGQVDWQHLTWEQNPTQFHIVNALADLPVLAWLPAMVIKSSSNLSLPENPERELR
jgi:acetoacetate decarboxylase